MKKKEYLNEDGSIDFAKFDLLSESEQLNDKTSWTNKQVWEYFSRDGVMTHEEFCHELDKIIEEVYGEVPSRK
ncbi:MAG: hypothetical protein ACI30H_02690 [Paludibacteraceae bacterium]